VLLVFQDVTAIRTLEAARRDFVANVSHEFRTPLSVINGYVETLQDGATEDPEMTATSLQAIHRNVQRLFLLLEDLLTISSMEGKGRRLEFSRVNLHKLAQRVIENLDTSGTAGQAVFELNWEQDAVFADADENRLEQVYWNLLNNAIRHGESRSPMIRISAGLAGDWVEILISDNGVGIPLEDQAHIFERFYRVHKHRARDAGGTGLGLSIVKNIVLAHGGQISLRSTPGEGATFIIRLPVTQNEIATAK
jgi:two-component system phosphate regulon sensor histidine kinase PhoR